MLPGVDVFDRRIITLLKSLPDNPSSSAA